MERFAKELQLKQMLVKILLIALSVAAIIGDLVFQQVQTQSQFQSYKTTFSKNYPPQEEIYRELIFMKNMQIIQNHNQREDKTYRMEVNQFADLTLQEFRQNYLGLTVQQSNTKIKRLEKDINYQVQIDWKKEGKVTRVKNQQMCASCWAFCTIGALQSAYMIQKGVYQQFSEQQLVDCSTNYGNHGCRGGQLNYTFQYLQAKGVNTQQSYPYIAKDQNCKKNTGPFKMAGYGRDITCGGLYNALLKGPVAVAVDALFWAFYKEGIYDDCGNQVNHGVLVVGVTSAYWLVKNSWGEEWGDHGYIKVKRGNTCSICEYPYYPLI